MSSSQTQKNQKLWQVLIGLGLGCFAGVIAAMNQPNTKNPVFASPVENVPIAIPSPVTQIPEIPLTVNSQPTTSPSALPKSDNVEIQKAQIEEIEKQKLQAALKAEQERQAVIRKEAAVRTEIEQLEAVIRENKHQDTLVAQKRQQADKQRQAKIKIENDKKASLQINQPPKKTPTTSNKRQLPPKQQVPIKQLKNVLNTNNDRVNIPKPWESTYPIPKAPDELEQVIREGNQ
ncbi:MAG: hypothetical protein V7L01_02870 [Nostoc sp.]|uniref:hypothetical protein n=1 Tax=Nostoc sp. TaxID=1180 RepID=UPI002FF7D3C0